MSVTRHASFSTRYPFMLCRDIVIQFSPFCVFQCDIPRAPGLGLLLDKCHFNHYNKKFSDTHEKLDWEEIKVSGDIDLD